MKNHSPAESKTESDDDPSILVLNRQRFRPVQCHALAQLARQVLAAVGQATSRLTITLVSDRCMRRLNRTYRSLDQPTDVLAFPNEPDFPHENHPRRDLGDVIISTETAARYAARYGISFEREIQQLVIHGVLHLCGYDHETDQGQMRQLERRLRRKLLGKA
ncbi:MAG: rRNA maturation RNase YbeY [Acidobacteriota bacterium]|nr:rRNA maturation RNase YbeY [Blastocatellia bacterium]MDW8238527.1 rRNA maturation RNase YbeY [Acidobacteriota bacterium]